ncbi:hypothetical protein HLB44_32155 [Aquincola sp. S2]|uniref:Molybdopterin dinucleotide-binding domain-containing protein n=1 Tax=Pseudaquabacterium terrae TaxID=2732868 RepID=A0ABX2ESN9_9BURK|nr:molybdopterin dinucleotide binding domain-containing protein [Aquabacterium terrae]NRF71652.1 hypothetical protein [Aquabacterium terrae]
MQNANQILRDPAAKRADPDGAMYVHPQDLADLGIADHGCVVVESRRAPPCRSRPCKRLDAPRPLHPSSRLWPVASGRDGRRVLRGPALNWLTDAAHRDPIADTPFHKVVPVRLSAAAPGAAVGTVETLP